MIGIFNYTVWLTYLSFLSASMGIIITFSFGKPLYGVLFLLFSGLCDAFDGKVASTKKDRTSFDKKYGIQIDSLSDVVAFGVLPAAIGVEIFNTSEFFQKIKVAGGVKEVVAFVLVSVSIMMYMLAAKIRLAYFNVTEDERQQVEEGARAHYKGLPVTSAALVFPVIFFLQKQAETAFIIIYFAVMVLMSFLFLLNFKVKKPGFKGVVWLTVVGLVEFLLILLFKFCFDL